MKFEGGELPTRLSKQPIIDAVAEIRFASTVDASLVLPGLLLKNSPDLTVERLPIAEMPDFIRQNDENLRHQPLVRLMGQKFFYLIGTSSIAVACKLPYQGWSEFCPEIKSAIDIVANAGFVSEINRYSIKYADVVEVNSQEEAKRYLDLEVNVAGGSIMEGAFNLTTQVSEGSIEHMIQIAVFANVQLMDGSTRKGALIATDSIVQNLKIPVKDFSSDSGKIFDDLHLANKRRFFSCLTADALTFLGAEYV